MEQPSGIVKNRKSRAKALDFIFHDSMSAIGFIHNAAHEIANTKSSQRVTDFRNPSLAYPPMTFRKPLLQFLTWAAIHRPGKKGSMLGSRASEQRGLPYMTSALEGGRGVPKQQTKGTKSADFLRDKGEGVKKSENFADVMDGSPQNQWQFLENVGPFSW